uniref:Uncharacterized protein n=1 Tax=Arundo donax TaxID=35708 RepID=A0A0A9B9V2_ARUDO
MMIEPFMVNIKMQLDKHKILVCQNF